MTLGLGPGGRTKRGQSPPGTPDGLAPRRTRPVLIWAFLGALCLALMLYLFVSWIAFGEAQSVPTGADPVSGTTQVWAAVFQIGGPIAAAIVLIHVVHRCVRERRLCLDAMIVIGTTTAWWLDPLINWLRPFVFYNATMVNFGSWSERIPGWISPNARFLPEPLLMIGLAYVWMTLGFGMLATRAMRAARARWPQLGVAATFGAGWSAVFVLELPLETLAVRTGLVAYPASIPELTLRAGHTYQVPLYGPALWSAVLTGIGALRFHLDERGFTLVERGIERVTVGARATTLLRTLAVVGFIHVSAVLAYDLPINLAGLYAGPVDPYPTHLRTQQCGPGTPVGCPGPGVPILMKDR